MNAQELQLKIHDTYKDIEFDSDSHTYKVGRQLLTSCTTYIKKFSIEFNPHMIAAVVARKHGIPAEYYKQRWKLLGDESRALGSRVHLYAQYGVDCLEPSDGYESSVKLFFTELNLNVVGKEVVCYHKSIAGTIDLITLNEDGTISIWDYKTNSNLDKYSGNKMLAPFDKVKDTPMNKYKVQLNVYKWILENSLGLTVRDMNVVHITKEGYKVIEVENLTEINP